MYETLRLPFQAQVNQVGRAGQPDTRIEEARKRLIGRREAERHHQVRGGHDGDNHALKMTSNRSGTRPPMRGPADKANTELASYVTWSEYRRQSPPDTSVLFKLTATN